MKSSDSFSRRDLIKWMTLTSAALCRPVSLLADSGAGHAATAEPDLKFPMSRPRLIYNQAAVEQLRKEMGADAALATELKKNGEKLIAAEFIPEDVAMRGEGQHASYGKPGDQMTDMGLALGLLFQLTGDARYAQKLRDAMLYYSNYVRWTGPRFEHRGPPWHSELDTAKFASGYATGYDAVHAFLSDADRKTIAEAMTRLAILPTLNDWVLPGTRIHSFDSMGHNWWGVCVANAGLCALALLGDDERAQEWIDAIDAGFEQWFIYPGSVLQNRVATFERSGPSYEGVNYTQYGVSEYLHYRLAWMHTYPGRKPARMEPLDHLARFFLHTLYPTSGGSYAVNFNDSSLKADCTATILLLTACGLGTPEGGRYLELVHSHPRGPFFTLLRQYPKPPAVESNPTSYIYPGMGWAMLRSSWENDATFLAVKSGYTWNHAHADAGSFILFKQGVPLIIDSGTCSYGRREYGNYYCESRAHNVILFDGSGQPQEDMMSGCKFSGHLHGLIDGLGMKYIYADATGPMARWFSRNYRHWLWSDDVILIIDDVLAHTAGQMDWLLHFEGQYRHEDGVRLKNGPGEAVVKMLYPPVTLHEAIGYADHDPDKRVTYLTFSPGAPMQSRQFITAICLNPEAMPKFELLQGDDYIGVRMQTRDATEETYLNLRAIRTPGSEAIRIGDWVTDAYLLRMKRALAGNQPVQRFFLTDGSYLRQKGRSLIESLTKLNVCWTPGEMLEVFSDKSSARVQFAAEIAPLSVKWNNRQVAGRYDGKARLVSLQF
jgi:oligo-alginate lyase